jgi:hypothetical protein
MSECPGRKDHEGKTSVSVPHGLVLAHECALLVTLSYPRYEENPGGRTGFPRNTRIHALVSPKCGTSWITPGPEFESGGSSLK